MNRRINTHLAFIVILFLAVSVSTYTLIKGRGIEYGDNYVISSRAKEPAKKKENTCDAHAYKGSAEINVWQTIKDEKAVLEVDEKDMDKMPQGAVNNFQLIDPTPEIKSKLKDSSSKNPVKIKISGFAVLCGGVYLASLDYEDGIFRPYIN